jgi:hypothetical protein
MQPITKMTTAEAKIAMLGNVADTANWATEGLPEGLPGVTVEASEAEASVGESLMATEGPSDVAVGAPAVRAPVLGFSKHVLMLRDLPVAVGLEVAELPLLGEPIDGATEGLLGVTVGIPAAVVVVGAWVVVLASGDP